MPDPFKPSASLLVKLGSLAGHIEEFLSPKGHAFDKTAINQILKDPEITEWLKQMDKQGFLPQKR